MNSHLFQVILCITILYRSKESTRVPRRRIKKYFTLYLSYTVVFTVPGIVRVDEIFLLFQSSTLLLISLSNSLVIALLLMLPLF